jgi:hypothetical protein
MKLYYRYFDNLIKFNEALAKDILECEYGSDKDTIESYIKNNTTIDFMIEMYGCVYEIIVGADVILGKNIVTLYEIRDGEPIMCTYQELEELVEKIKLED